ncbi:MAG: hypothetical protein SFW67_12470 [Myxococcaceae bacterium]|nr:hypothetical protein [Myxococcaceae bacterium]
MRDVLSLVMAGIAIIGGLSGALVLKGTQSSAALVVVGVVFAIIALGRLTREPQQPENPGGARTSNWRLNLLWTSTDPGQVVSHPLAGPVSLGVVEVVDGRVKWLSPADVAMDFESALQVARARLQEASWRPPELVAPGVFRGSWGDGLAAARLALPELVETVAVEGAPIAVVTTEDSFLLTGETSGALDEALRLGEADAANVRAGVDRCPFPLWRFTEGAWAPWDLPEGHPLSPRVKPLRQAAALTASA